MLLSGHWAEIRNITILTAWAVTAQALPRNAYMQAAVL